MVNIKSFKAGFILRIVQILILAYIVGYSIVWKKGYQATCEGAGDSVSKLKGVSYSNGSLPWLGPNATTQEFHIYDTYDLVQPGMESNAIFVTTNMSATAAAAAAAAAAAESTNVLRSGFASASSCSSHSIRFFCLPLHFALLPFFLFLFVFVCLRWVTLGQVRSRCVWFDPSNSCDAASSTRCESLQMTQAGRQIGPEYCLVNSTDPTQLYPTPPGAFCLLYGWCPTEQELPLSQNSFRLRGVENFTLFTRIIMRYSDFDRVLDNTAGEDALTPGLNTWALGEMVRESGFQWKDINTTGALIAMETKWCSAHPPRRWQKNANKK